MQNSVFVLHCPRCGQPFRYAPDEDPRFTHTCQKCRNVLTISATVVGGAISELLVHAKELPRDKRFMRSVMRDSLQRQNFADVEIRALAHHCRCKED